VTTTLSTVDFPRSDASAAATLDHLGGGRVLINIVAGKDDLAAYGDSEGDQAGEPRRPMHGSGHPGRTLRG
jgi:alkanesulfonate monooxygenase SsuD/methylene tetrahydromethanopterin reductase-like flavin-dependent oxidoreductase (luciferase family)